MTPPRPPMSMLMCAPQGGRFTDAKKTHISVLESRRCIFNIELRGCRGDPSQCMMVWVSARFFRSGRERFQQSSIKHTMCACILHSLAGSLGDRRGYKNRGTCAQGAQQCEHAWHMAQQDASSLHGQVFRLRHLGRTSTPEAGLQLLPLWPALDAPSRWRPTSRQKSSTLSRALRIRDCSPLKPTRR